MNPRFCRISQKCAFTGPDKVFPACQTHWEGFGTEWETRKPHRSAANAIMAENVTQRQEEDKQKEQDFTNDAGEFLLA